MSTQSSHMPETKIRQQMMRAKAHIQLKEYNKARKILVKVDHPKAKEWLEKLPKQDNRKGRQRINLIFLIVILVVGGGVVVTGLVHRGYENILKERTIVKTYDSPNNSALTASGEQWLYSDDGDHSSTLYVGTVAFNDAYDHVMSAPSVRDMATRTTLLEIRCKSGQYEAFLSAESRVQTVDGYVAVGIGFDDDPTQDLLLHPSTSNDAGFFDQGTLANLFFELSQSKQLLVMFTLANGLPRAEQYDVSGFRNAVAQMEASCGPVPKA